MFTGIIETVGEILELSSYGGNKTFWISSTLSSSFQIDQSVSHDGVCLTVEELAPGAHRVTAVEETLNKTNIKQWNAGDKVNLERSMLLTARIDGHIVQGHVDSTARCIAIDDMTGSFNFRFEIEKDFSNLIVEKGSICLNGISLTIFDVSDVGFTVAVIPYTYANTNISKIQISDMVNVEFDLLGKYVNRMLQTRM